ncbi:MAG: DUF4233 domain-containing protein [Jiangellaceae bacterium]
MNRIAATVLSIEAVVIALAIPVAVGVSDVDAGTAVPGGLAVAVACVVTAALLRRGRFAYYVGSVLQVVAVALGFVVPIMFVLGAIFALLWFLTLRLGHEVEAARREHQPPSRDHEG